MSFFEKIFGLDHITPHNEATSALLLTVHGSEELAAVEALLRAAELPYRICDRGAGSAVRVFAGYTIYGTDVFVRPEDLDTAQALLAPIDPEQAETNENAESEDTDA